MDISTLRQALRYDPKTGRLYRGRVRIAGTRKYEGGPLVFNFGAQRYTFARVCFALHYGYAPARVRHVNGDQQDNRADNLYDPANPAAVPKRAALPHAGKYPGVYAITSQYNGKFRGYRGDFYFAKRRYYTPVVETPEQARDLRAALKSWIEYAAHQKDSQQ